MGWLRRRLAPDAQQQQLAAFLMHDGQGQRHRLVADFCDSLIRFAAAAHGVEQFADHCARIRVDTVDDLLADHPPHGVAKGFGSGRIGFDNFLGFAIDHQHAFRGQIEQDAVTGFQMTQAQVVTLHGLLCIDQLLLDFRLRAQVTTQRDHAAFGPDGNGAK